MPPQSQRVFDKHSFKARVNVSLSSDAQPGYGSATGGERREDGGPPCRAPVGSTNGNMPPTPPRERSAALWYGAGRRGVMGRRGGEGISPMAAARRSRANRKTQLNPTKVANAFVYCDDIDSGAAVLFDSVSGLTDISRIFVLYELNKAYPQYLISYTCS